MKLKIQARAKINWTLDVVGTLPNGYHDLDMLMQPISLSDALIFAPAMYGEIEYDLEGRSYTPLQTTYRFGQPAGRSNHVNGNWTRVDYNKNFTITIQ